MALLKSESLNFADSRLLSSTADSTDGHRLDAQVNRKSPAIVKDTGWSRCSSTERKCYILSVPTIFLENCGADENLEAKYLVFVLDLRTTLL
ncbi:unnamed protein product [Tenebrio molitor]|nr:unnamed protein product [Tenebrio molitor]